MHPVTLSLMVARTDVRWIEPMLRHLCGAHRKSVVQILVFVDTAPLGPAYRNRPGVGTMEELRGILAKVQADGLIDGVKDIPYDSRTRKDIYEKYFGRDLRVTHNFRGYPVLGSIYSIEEVATDWVLHFDSDILLHQKTGLDWVREAIDLMTRREDILFAAPRPGPPRSDGVLLQRGLPYSDEGSFYSFKKFSSRIYLFSKKRLESLLPIEPKYISWKRRLWQEVTGQSALWNWEIMVSEALRSSASIRANLKNLDCWTLHTPDHGPEFVENLPGIIQKVEAGWFPESQAGDYDIILKDWIL